MASQAAASAYSFEQLESSGLVRSSLDGIPLATAGDDEDERRRDDAVRAAIADGRAAGLAEGRAQVKAAISALSSAISGIEAMRGEIAEQTEQAAVELALALSEQIIGGALEVQPERVLDVVRGALRRLAERHRVTIIVHPEDAATINEGLTQLRGELGGIDEATVQADRRVTRGGAVVQTVEGALDVQVESQLERARSVVAGELAP